MNKTIRDFHKWDYVINDRGERINFQESSAIGMNTWLCVTPAKDLNKAIALTYDKAYADMTDTEKVLYVSKLRISDNYDDNVMIHLSLENLIELAQKIAEVIAYQVKERSKWYDD